LHLFGRPCEQAQHPAGTALLGTWVFARPGFGGKLEAAAHGGIHAAGIRDDSRHAGAAEGLADGPEAFRI
jgi:hypothetical protein